MKIKRACVLLAGLLLLLPLMGCGVQKPDIAKIAVLQGGFGDFKDYKIDLESRQFWAFIGGHNARRDETAPDEGYELVKDLEQKDIDTFLREASKSGFLNWGDQSKYSGSEYVAGHNWVIFVYYVDGTMDEFGSTANYPETWDRMFDAFEALTGERVLGYKKDSQY